MIGKLADFFGERFERLVDRIEDMSHDADAMMVSMSDMRALLEIARNSDGFQVEIARLNRELGEERQKFSRVDGSNKELREAIRSGEKKDRCETCAVHRRREEVLFEQLRAANIRLEGAGNGAVKLAQGVANLIGSFLPEGTSQPSTSEVSRRLGVYVPGSTQMPALKRPSLFQEALDRLPELPAKKE
jgi:hypothetical protein